jgi:release factor glutamine methyltransferase
MSIHKGDRKGRPHKIRRRLGRFFRPVAFRLLRPLLRWLGRRDAVLFGCRLRAAPGVFHPTLYFSTKALAQHLLSMNLSGKTFLDAGTGSGALGILAAKRGAAVMAVDVNPAAVSLSRSNASLNGVSNRFETIESDLFSAIPADRRFDLIAFNPPFYPRPAGNDEERAWLAGEDYQTLRAFFRDAGRFLAPSGQVVLIFSSDADLDLLARIAEENGFNLLREKVIPHLFETFVIREYFKKSAVSGQPSAKT